MGDICNCTRTLNNRLDGLISNLKKNSSASQTCTPPFPERKPYWVPCPESGEVAMDLALLEMAANGTALDAGQAALVRQMCSSGARLQLAIAPAGAGKTTAMRALVLAWTQDGGQVVGLAPSAAASLSSPSSPGSAATHSPNSPGHLTMARLPDWAAAVRPSRLVIIDEAGMADTLSLDAAVQFAIDRGASVRLIGDDQQLAAIGAGGVLRDIKQTHGALHLTELHRFANPGEAAASPPSATATRRRSTSTSITIASTSATSPKPPKMPSPLGSWTDQPALTSCSPPPVSWSPNSTVAPVIIASTSPQPRGRYVSRRQPGQCRRCDHHPGQRPATPPHRHRLGQNGDRWTITHVAKQGDLTVRHTRSHQTVELPADYVRTSTGLGCHYHPRRQGVSPTPCTAC